MMTLPSMLMIGAAGANAGKTSFACTLLRGFSDTRITGIKVTTVAEKNGTCPRGGKGCGACSSLSGNYRIDVETDAHTGKDTSRLLAAGAARVFWLRVLRDRLAEGFDALRAVIGKDAVCICESNSLRTVVEPGLFLMVKARSSARNKSSAEAVKSLADRVILTEGEVFSFEFSDVDLLDGRWVLRERATALVMAGGASKRMGRDKAMLPLDGRPMIETVCLQLRGNFDQVLVSGDERDRYAFLGLDVVPDRAPGQGPLMGLGSALQASLSDLNLVVACDIPKIDMALARRMLREAEGYDAVVPRREGGELEPLFAVYRKSVGETVWDVLASGQRRVRAVLERCKVKYLDIPESNSIVNLNTMDDYRNYVGQV